MGERIDSSVFSESACVLDTGLDYFHICKSQRKFNQKFVSTGPGILKKNNQGQYVCEQILTVADGVKPKRILSDDFTVPQCGLGVDYFLTDQWFSENFYSPNHPVFSLNESPPSGFCLTYDQKHQYKLGFIFLGESNFCFYTDDRHLVQRGERIPASLKFKRASEIEKQNHYPLQKRDEPESPTSSPVLQCGDSSIPDWALYPVTIIVGLLLIFAPISYIVVAVTAYFQGMQKGTQKAMQERRREGDEMQARRHSRSRTQERYSNSEYISYLMSDRKIRPLMGGGGTLGGVEAVYEEVGVILPSPSEFIPLQQTVDVDDSPYISMMAVNVLVHPHPHLLPEPVNVYQPLEMPEGILGALSENNVNFESYPPKNRPSLRRVNTQ